MPIAIAAPREKNVSWLAGACRRLLGTSLRYADPEAVLDNTVRALVREVEASAHAATVSCAIANAIEMGIPVPQSEVQRHFPNRAKIFPKVLYGGTRLYLDRDSAVSFSMLHSSAALAAELSMRHVTAVGSGHSYRLMHSGAADAWRMTAQHAMASVQQAVLLCANTGVAYRIAEVADLTARLKAVADGAALGVDRDGHVTATEPTDERRNTRYIKSIPGTVVADLFTAPVMVRDISCGGCGFDTTRPFPIGTNASLQMQDGSYFMGSIAWAIGMSAGLRFDQPITDQEAMSAGERQNGRRRIKPSAAT